MTFGEKVRILRTTEGLTQRQLGERLGLSGRIAETRVQNWELGRAVPDIPMMKKLARACRTTLDVMLEDVDE